MVISATGYRAPSRSSRRRRIASAAWLVKVTAVISAGGTPRRSTSQAARSTRVPVFPVPGPAITATTSLSLDSVYRPEMKKP